MHRHTHGSMHTQIHTCTARQNHRKPKERKLIDRGGQTVENASF